MTNKFTVNNFDLLRLFAASEVLLMHSYPRLHIPTPAFLDVLLNFPGVFMFFVMSGFLISASLERNKNLKTYFRNRILRIFPALWACILVSVIVIPLTGSFNFISQQGLTWFACQLFGLIYTPDFLKSFGFGSYNGSLWTIPLELQFYFVLPVLYFIATKISKKELNRTYLFIIVFLAFCFVSYYIKIDFTNAESQTLSQKIMRYTFINSIYLFLFGVILQRLKVFQSRFIYGKGLFWLALYMVVSHFVPTSNETVIFKLLFLGLTTISLAYTFPSLAKKLLKGNDISYGLYIYHGLILGIFVQLKLFSNPAYILLLITLSITLATLSWFFIEKPIIKMKKRGTANKANTSIETNSLSIDITTETKLASTASI